jgi:hypothetical protein
VASRGSDLFYPVGRLSFDRVFLGALVCPSRKVLLKGGLAFFGVGMDLIHQIGDHVDAMS